MSLLIDNDMNLPNSCSKCPLKYSSYDMYCCRTIYGDGSIVCVDSYTERRNPACPLVEIPTPHGDLIDRSELLNQYKPDPEEEHLMKTENPIAYKMMDKIVDKVTESINSVKAIIEAEG